MATVNGIHRESGEKLLIVSGQRIWFCDGCGQAFTWDGSSSCYGSERDIDNSEWSKIWIACSAACKQKKPPGFPRVRLS